MSREEILSALTEIFRENFDDETLSISAGTTQEDIEEWDSLEQINLLTAAEERFGVKFTLEDVRGVVSVGDMAALVQRALEGKS